MLKLLQSIMKENITIEKLEDHIYTVIDQSDRDHEYDAKVTIYDNFIANPGFNRIIWGNNWNNYGDFAKKAINTKSEGIAIDIGCGSLVFTESVYSQYSQRPLILFDRSLGMIRKAKKRLLDLGGISDNIIFLQGDALNLPFKENSFDSVLSFGMYHIFSGDEHILEIIKVAKDTADIHLTSIINDRFPGCLFLKILQKKGLVAKNESAKNIQSKLKNIGLDMSMEVIGNFAFLSRI